MRLNPLHWFKKDEIKVTSEDYESFINLQIKSFESQFGIKFNPKTFAGETVTVDSAMGMDTVYACIRDKSESIGQLPIVVKRNDIVLGRGKREHKIFAQKPNDYMTTQDLLEMYVTCMETRGNFYVLPIRNRYGSISELLPLRYQENVITQMDQYGNVYHTYITNDGKPAISFAGDELIHIKLNSLNGIMGMSPIQVTAMAHGVALSQEQYLGSLMENSAMPKGILKTDKIFKDPAALERLREQWSKKFGGAKQSGKTPLMEGGLQYESLGLSPADSELIKQRIFSKVQLCGIYRVPPSRVGVIEAQKYSKLEDNNRAYMRDSLVPLITKFEAGINNELPDDLMIKIDTKQFVRGDRISQVEAVTKEFATGSIKMNEVRVDLDRDPIEGGDVHAIDTNNFTFGKLTDIPKLQEQARLAAQQNIAKPPQEDSEDVE